jgi:phosphoenolpyruvate carboxylase
MAACADRHKIEVTFFHGKGGTVGRGGNPAVYAAILAHPPHTINGRFRVTEQGEMITQNLGQEGMAEKTLDLFTAGVLAERFVERPEPKKEWREAMERLSKVSCAAYRQVVREEPRFVPYFRSATPELELSGLNVGSRPAKRNPKGGVESLRAIPWVFAWTQTRLNLPAWLGVGAGLEQEFKTNPEVLKEMYKDWPWFRTIIDLVEMILSKSESDIAANYDKQLVNDEASLALGRELRALLEGTTQSVLAITGHTVLQENNPNLLRSMLVRNPYVDPLNVIQAELLQRIRKDGNEEDEVLRDALLITINGIANGMRNSG